MRQHSTRPKNLRCGLSSKRLTREPNTPRTSNDCVVVVLQASASLRDPSVGLRAEAPKSSLRMTQKTLCPPNKSLILAAFGSGWLGSNEVGSQRFRARRFTPAATLRAALTRDNDAEKLISA